jgi:hypothetical protein
MGQTIIPITPTVPPASNLGAVAHTARATVWDVVEHLCDYLGLDITKQVPRVVRRSIQAALREVSNARRWTYFYKHGRILTHGFYSTGTVQYQDSSGTYPRQITLTGGTWPSWAARGTLRIGIVTYDVDQMVNSTVLTLDPVLNPGPNGDALIPAGTPFQLYCDTYDLPEDFIATDQEFADISWGGMEYVHPNKWLQVTRYYASYSNTPRYYTIRGNPKIPNRLSVSIFPFPDSDRTIDFVYHRGARKVTIDRYQTGSASVNASGGATQTVTGTGTNWTASMAGSVIRLSGDSLNFPTDFAGDNPAAIERNIVSVQSATQLTVDDAISQSFSGVKYRISDPIDVESGAMYEAFVRCAEMHASIQRNSKDRELARKEYMLALEIAKEADSRNFAVRVAGMGGPYRQRLANMPRGPDIP